MACFGAGETAYLVLVHREQVMEFLWPGLGVEAAANNLHKDEILPADPRQSLKKSRG